MTVETASFLSSNLDSAEYDTDTRTLTITFARDGSQYTYVNVPETVWQGLSQSTSAGGYFARYIKGIY